MPITLIDTPSATDANTYADLTFYKSYISTRRPQPKWAALAAGSTIDEQLKGDLVASFPVINAGFVWTGQATNENQSGSWPRIGMLNRNGFAISSDIVPIDLKIAQCELAVQMHDADLLSDNQAVKKGVSSVKAGSVAVAFQDIDTSTNEAVSAAMRRQESRFNYLSDAIPRTVRLLLVPSWYVEADIRPQFMMRVMGLRRRYHHS